MGGCRPSQLCSNAGAHNRRLGVIFLFGQSKLSEKCIEHWEVEYEGTASHEQEVLLMVNRVLAEQLKCSGDTKPSELPPCRLGIQTATERIEVGLRGKVWSAADVLAMLFHNWWRIEVGERLPNSATAEDGASHARA